MDIESLKNSFVLNLNFTGYLSKVLLFLITFPTNKTRFFLNLVAFLYKLPFLLMKTSSRCLGQDEHVCFGHTSSEDIFKMSSRRLDQDEYIRVSHTSSRCLQDVFKRFSRRL